MPVALIAMILIGAIVTGGFYASSEGSQVSTSTEYGAEAFQVAEYGLEEALGTWTNAQVSNGTWTAEGNVTRSDGAVLGTYTREVAELGAGKFLVSSEGRVVRGQRTASRRIGVLVETTDAQLPYQSALTVFGAVSAKGTSTIDGTDDPGPGTVCPSGAGLVPGVTALSIGMVSDQGSAEILGDPPKAEDPDMTRDRLSDYGAVQLDEIIASATKVLDPGTTLTGLGPTLTTVLGEQVCDQSLIDNWGDPEGTGPCMDYMPVIHAEGTLNITGGVGQGILIVEGDLNAAGGFSFYGIAVVKGTLKTTGTGAHFNGSVIVQGDGDLDSESTSAGNSVVQYSQCRVERAFDAALRISPLPHRSWIDLSGVAPVSS